MVLLSLVVERDGDDGMCSVVEDNVMLLREISIARMGNFIAVGRRSCFCDLGQGRMDGRLERESDFDFSFFRLCTKCTKNEFSLSEGYYYRK